MTSASQWFYGLCRISQTRSWNQDNLVYVLESFVTGIKDSTIRVLFYGATNTSSASTFLIGSLIQVAKKFLFRSSEESTRTYICTYIHTYIYIPTRLVKRTRGIWNNVMRSTRRKIRYRRTWDNLESRTNDRSYLRSRKPVSRDTIFFRSAHHRCITPRGRRLTDRTQPRASRSFLERF